jgi:hypothetical protein
MNRFFFSLLALALQWFGPQCNAQHRLMAALIRIFQQGINASALFYHVRPESSINASTTFLYDV